MVDYKLELVALPVADLNRSRTFYGETLGWPIDHDQEVDETTHFIQVTPPGSACSIAFGRGVSEMAPGSLKALQVVVMGLIVPRRSSREAAARSRCCRPGRRTTRTGPRRDR